MQLLRLRELRKNHKLTQKKVAAHLQLSSDAYSLYELGKRQMNYETLFLLADLFDVSIDYLLGRYEKNSTILDSDESEVVRQYRLLDKRGKDTIKANIAFEGSQINKNRIIKKPAI